MRITASSFLIATISFPFESFSSIASSALPGSDLAKNLDHDLETHEEAHNLGELFSIKKELFTFDRASIATGLNIARRIRGVGMGWCLGALGRAFSQTVWNRWTV
jgi:hypothetical protein